MSGPAVWIEIGDRPRHVDSQPELPTRGAIVRVEKVDNVVMGHNHLSAAYRLTDRDGKPLLMGLSNTVDAAMALARSRGWRPETASIITQPKQAPAVKKSLPKTNQIGLGLDG